MAGLIGGVAFGVLVVRALLSALLFGAGGALLAFLVGRFLPGLLESSSEESARSGRQERDVAADSTAAGEKARRAPGGRLNIVVEDDGSESTEEEDLPPGDEGDLVDEVEEQSVDDEEAVMKSIIAEESESDTDTGEDAMDVMPDIGGFAGSFVGPGSEGTDDENGSEDGSSGGATQDRRGKDSGNDPVQIAQALRTMMNRDQ
ncbi:MAG: hypothetical protein EA427_10545 [Spirochaetaceae bacterium]|nr:MAG: hypothetical protein EA427_10545 [Spirochaetaceae bacterium]